MGVKFLVDIQAVCIIFSHGDVVLFHNEATEMGETVEVVGSVDSGISCMAWSPDEELVVMVTGNPRRSVARADRGVLGSRSLN